MGNSIASAGGCSSKVHRKCQHSSRQNFCEQQRNFKGDSHQTTPSVDQINSDLSGAPPPNPENSRVLFLLYLIHRTWNVVVDTVDTKSKRSRLSAPCTTPDNSGAARSYFQDTNNWSCRDDCTVTDMDEDSLGGGSQYSICSCSHCYSYDLPKQNVYNSILDIDSSSMDQRTMSRCDSELSSFYTGYQMAPSICQSSSSPSPPHPVNRQTSKAISDSVNGSSISYKMTNSESSWPQNFSNKENQRPPVYNPEDYAVSLKKFGKRQTGTNIKSIYDTADTNIDRIRQEAIYRSATLPSKHSDYRIAIVPPCPELDGEMSLRQFGSVTDLLTKLRADLRVSFPSFVQEFVATPSDGVSLLLEVLRAIQLSQTMSAATSAPMTASMPRNAQSYQRRALLDELACLQCLSLCCSRSPEAGGRLGTTPVGLLPLAASATGQGIRARILAMQLMSSACDRSYAVNGSQRNSSIGHIAVSEALSTLRLRCGEPVRFKLLVGMLNSGGGSGELQAIGVKFLNTFLESAENLQSRLYLQAELHQAGFEPFNLSKTISSSSPWLECLRKEVRHFNELRIDIEEIQAQARESERVRSQMVILERRVQILHEEKTVLTTMERRLQERCAELQREIFRIQGAQSESVKSIEKRPVALPRHVPPPAIGPDHSKQDLISEHEDEGISSSETGPSLSPVPILILPQNGPHQNYTKTSCEKKVEEDATIEDVIEELENIVSDAEKEISTSSRDGKSNLVSKQNNLSLATDDNPSIVPEVKETDIVPVNIRPIPPRRSRSLNHLFHSSTDVFSDIYGTEWGRPIMMQNNVNSNFLYRQHQHFRCSDDDDDDDELRTFFDEVDYETLAEKSYGSGGDGNDAMVHIPSTTNREILDVIMNSRHSDDDPTMRALRECSSSPNSPGEEQQNQDNVANSPLANHFNAEFFMASMNKPQKYPKPDLTAALEARRVSQNVKRIEAAFSQESLNQVAHEKLQNNQQIYFGSNPALRINTSYDSFTNNVTVINNVTTRTRSHRQGSKVTDLLSGLY